MRVVTMAAGGAASLALLAGCGGSGFADESVDEIIKQTSADMKALDSLRLKGDIASDGQEVSVDMRMTTDGDCTGTFGLMGGTAELLSVDGQTWFKPDEAFWRASSPDQADMIMGVVGDKWVVMPAEESEVSEFCDLDSLLDEFAKESDDDKDVSKGETGEVDGEETIIINGESDEGDPMKAWIATEGKHYILKLEVTDGEEPGTITFSEFNEDVDVEAPAEDEVIDLTSVSG